MSWAKFDDQYFRHGKIVAAGRDARDMHMASILHCCEYSTDGKVEQHYLKRIYADSEAEMPLTELVQRMVEFRLYDVRNGQLWVHDFLQYNRSKEQIEEDRRKRSEAGKAGGMKSGEARREANAEANASTSTRETSKQNTKQNANPVSRIQNPDSRNQMPVIPGGSTNPGNGIVPSSAENRTSTAPKYQGVTTPSWERYAEAYQARWGVEPIRTAEVNAHLKRLVENVGVADAPSIAAFYVTLNKKWYVDHQHDLKYLASDYQSIRTQWKTGRTVTSRGAGEADRLQETGNVIGRLQERAAERAKARQDGSGN